MGTVAPPLHRAIRPSAGDGRAWRWRVPAGLSRPGEPAPARTPDVHFVPTDTTKVREMLTAAQVGAGDLVYDLGCGDGRIVITAVKKYGARGVCVDIDPVRIKESKNNADTAGVTNRIEFVEGDLFEQDLSKATVVTLYLLPSLNERLRPKLFKELRPGTRIVSNAFDMGAWKADRTLEHQDRVSGCRATPICGFSRPTCRGSGDWSRRGQGRQDIHARHQAEVPGGFGYRSVGREAAPASGLSREGRPAKLRAAGRRGRGPGVTFTGQVDGDRATRHGQGEGRGMVVDRGPHQARVPARPAAHRRRRQRSAPPRRLR